MSRVGQVMDGKFKWEMETLSFQSIVESHSNAVLVLGQHIELPVTVVE